MTSLRGFADAARRRRTGRRVWPLVAFALAPMTAAGIVPAVAAVAAVAAPAPKAKAATVPALAHGGTPARLPASAYRVPATPPQRAGGNMLPPAGSGGRVAPARFRAMAAAAARAVATGRPVVVAALTTPTVTVSADPRGGFTLDESLLPVRVRRGAGWAPVSAALRRMPGGGLAPVAVPGSLRMSGGGVGPLAVLGGGKWSAALRWPLPLPVPRVSGATAVYRGVLPGVDLLVTALDRGGFSQTLVIRDARAARDRGLARLLWPVTVAGARLTAGPGGTLAGMRGGRAAFRVSDPVMWDSASRRVPRGAPVPGPLASSAGGPGVFAHIARARQVLAGGGRAIAVIPDRSMLESRATVFPVYLDPTWLPASNTDIDFDMVQQTAPCAGTSYYDNLVNYGQDLNLLHVGYYPPSYGGCYGTQRAYYDFTLPSVIDQAVINLATMDAREDYTASCTLSAAVNIHESHGITRSTDYNAQPAWYPTDVSDADGDGTTDNNGGVPDGAQYNNNKTNNSCNGIQDSSGNTYVPYGFTVTHAVSNAANSSPPSGSVTFVLTEDNQDSSGASFKKFTNNPTLQIQYNFRPYQPTDLKVGDNSANLQDCSGTPRVGASTGGVVLAASFADKDGDALNETFRYWIPPGQSAASGYTNLGPTTGGKETIPRTAYDSLKDGTQIDFEAYATDPAGLTSPVSGTCAFLAYPTATVGPGITQDFTGSPAMGSTATFTISPPSGCTATDFRWTLDQAPPVGGGTKVTTSNTAVAVSIIVPSPGAHELFAYADCSNNPNPSDTSGSKFTAAGDQPVSCASFAAALANTCSVTSEHFDNTMLSGNSGSCGATAGDGSGHQFEYPELTAQGWLPGGTVTVDGASFTLPGFGNCATDNILAANQTITMSGQGSALVFLATSSYAQTHVPALGTAAPDAPLVNSVLTAPPVPAGIAVTGDGCSGLTAFDGTASGCTPAQGTITYTDGTTAPYWLTVPDWWNGPADIAAVSIADADTSSGGHVSPAPTPKMFAFAVPLNPGKQVASVTLPDVGDTVTATGLTSPLSALHVFGMAVRNTTTATPAQPGAACQPGCAAPAGQAWTAAFESPIESGWGPANVSSQTYRMAVSPDISAPQGASIRIRLSDPGFLSGDADGRIMIGDATIAPQYYGPAAGQAPQQLTFGGAGCVVIPAGGDAYSDPVTLGFPVTAGQNLLVSLYVANGSAQTCGNQGALPAFSYTPGLASPSGASQWIASGDQATNSDGSTFPGSSWTWSVSLLTSVDVTTPAATIQGVAAPGAPTVVVAGNNVTDAFGAKAAGDFGAPSFRIAGQLATAVPSGQSAPVGQGFGVVDAGIESNQVQAGSASIAAVSLLARLDRDVLAEPGVGTVIIDEGLEDLLHGASVDAVTGAYGQAYNILYGFGVTVVFATLTPCAGYAGTGSPADACTAGGAADAARNADGGVNSWIGNNTQVIVAPYRFEANFDVQVATACPSPDTAYECLGSTYDNGDHVNLTAAGYAQAATAVTEPATFGDLQPAMPPPAPPPQNP